MLIIKLISNIFFLTQLTVEFGVGIAVLVRCFVDRRAIESEIVDRLGDGFSRPPFATVVVCVTINVTHLILIFSLYGKLSLFVCGCKSMNLYFINGFSFDRFVLILLIKHLFWFA